MAAVASFLTPIGHHGNLLIYVRADIASRTSSRGHAVLILVGIVASVMAPLLWRG
jgi:di/tricarboxylate transporter